MRFSDRVSADTYIKVMTDGILLAETQGDRLLRAYDTIIIDEAHERSLNIDFLLGYLKELLRASARPDLKLIVTSATIETERFSRHFAHGRCAGDRGLGPHSTRSRCATGRSQPRTRTRKTRTSRTAILDAVDELAREPGGGDILVFLPGEREIRETADALRKHHPKGAEILPLYARLSFEEQERVFHPGGARRIVLATNVAETSLTVPGIRYVVDTGLARVNRYSWRNKVEQLQIEKISRPPPTSAPGAAAASPPGICIRLYSEDDYARAAATFTDPEILRSSLAAVILRMKALRPRRRRGFPVPRSAGAAHDRRRLPAPRRARRGRRGERAHADRPPARALSRSIRASRA